MAVEAGDRNFEPLKPLKGLPEDLQMLGHYLLIRKKRLRDDAREVGKSLTQVFKNPGDVALNAEDFAKAMDFTPAEVRAMEKKSLNPAIYKREIEDIETLRDEIDLMILDLKKGKYGDCLRFLRESVLPAEVLTHQWDDSPEDNERMWGEQRAIQSYILLLEAKSKAN